jgi:hypothetical protein
MHPTIERVLRLVFGIRQVEPPKPKRFCCDCGDELPEGARRRCPSCQVWDDFA